MTTRTIRIAMAVATAVVCLVGVGGVAVAKPCVPVAHITGDAEIVRELAAALVARSLTVEEQSKCGVVTARVTKDEKHILVSVIDAGGRHAQRSADTVDIAATIVESWLRQDVAASLLDPRIGPARTKRSAPKDPVLTAAAPPRTRDIDLGVGAELGLGEDGSVWSGARVHGCFTVGRLCVGALIRYSFDLESAGDAEQFGSSRTLLDTIVTVDVPLRRGNLELTPGIGVGQSMLRVAGYERFPESPGMDGEEIADDTAGIRVEAHVAAGYALSDAWTLRGDASVGFVGFARRQFGEVDDEEPEPEDDRLAGMPALHSWFGISVVYGGL